MPGFRRDNTLSILGFGIVLFIAVWCRPYAAFFFHRIEDTDVTDYRHVIGIDLGSTFARVGVSRNNSCEIICDEEGRSAIPNYVSFLDNGAPLVGFEANEKALSSPRNTIYDIRRLIGRSFPDPGLQTAIKELPYDVVDVGGKPAIKIETKNGISQLTPEEILGYVLEKLTSMAETHLNTSVRYAVLTVPSYFNDEQRDATKHAAEGTGLNVLRMVNEPTAIGIAHSLDTKPCDEAAGQFDCTYLLYDIQEKELDLTLLSVYRGVFEIIGAVHDDRMRWEVFHGSPVQNQVNLYDHISQQPEHIIRLVQQLLIDAKVKKTEINGIVCTGDPTHIAEVQTILKAYFPGTKTITPSDFLPDQAAVCGAATQGQVFNESQDSQPQIMDANVLSLGIEISNGTFLRIINRETVIPTRKFRTLSTSADGQGKIMIKIFEGERVIASKNKMIGSLELNGIPTASKGTQQIEITFEVDANEILTATAHLKGGSEVAKAVMPVRWMRYTLQEIDDIIQEAEKFNEDDLQHLKRTR